jgi:purine-nucleoside phosphorylase
MELFDKISQSTAHIAKFWESKPSIGIILGTGLGGLVEEITVESSLPYEEIPHFPTSTVKSHAGRLVCGKLSGKNVMAMEGRFHFYEGYSLEDITFPVRVMKRMGCNTLIVSNASGCMNPMWSKGDIMIIDDHINLIGDNPLRGKNDERLGVRFPDMSRPYDEKLIELAESIARWEGIRYQKGVFVAVAGPNLETRAEYRFLRTIGADVVGMSTVPEVIVGVHSGMRILGLSVITDMCLPDSLKPVSLEEVIEVAKGAENGLRTIVKNVIKEI